MINWLLQQILSWAFTKWLQKKWEDFKRDRKTD